MRILFNLQMPLAPRGNRNATVPAVDAVLSGVYDEASGAVIKPDLAAVRNAIPYHWRKAFDRAGSFWTVSGARLPLNGERCNMHAPCYVTLYGVRGQTIGSIYATPYRY